MFLQCTRYIQYSDENFVPQKSVLKNFVTLNYKQPAILPVEP